MKHLKNLIIYFSSMQKSYLLDMVGRQGFEPWKPMAADLQSAPVDHLGTCPFDQLGPFF